MNRVKIDRVTMHAPAAQASEGQARRIAELLGKAVADADSVISGGRIVVEVPGGGSMTAERIAQLAARQLKRRLT